MTDLARIEAAAHSAASALHSALCEDVAARLTCPEAEAIAELYTCLGYTDIAADIIEAHAASDDDDTDLHHAAYVAQREHAARCTCRTDVPEAPGSGGYLARIAGCPVHDAYAAR